MQDSHDIADVLGGELTGAAVPHRELEMAEADFVAGAPEGRRRGVIG
ncbi:hypothetical protein ACQP1O_22200 [Nocardia sp. CA-151230]